MAGNIRKTASPWDNETPIREELFSLERLETHARSLAVAQIVAAKATRGVPLSARLADNGAVLLAAYRAPASLASTFPSAMTSSSRA